MNLPPLGSKGSEDRAQIYTIGAARAIAVAFPQIRSIGMWRPPDGFNEHSSGMAADVMIPDWNTPIGKTLGDEVCKYALTLQGVDYVIWRQAMHYRSGRVTGMSDRGSPTQNHMDHNHVHTTGGGYPGPGQVYTAAGATSTIGARFWPLGAGRIVTSPFGPRSGGFHTGTDFGRAGGSAGMPVFACQGGNVIMAGAAQGYGGPDPAGWLVIDHTNADGAGCTEYGHIVREVDKGQRVSAGQRIGYINPDQGSNGGVSPHLHFALMPREYNPSAKMDPLPWLAGAREPGAPQIPPPPPAPTEAAVDLLLRAMGGSVHRDRYRALLPRVSASLKECQCHNVERISMWMAQVGHESGGLKYQEEIASGAAYEGRKDLGNTQPGDGVRFKGRDFIQITGRGNYGQLSKWAHQQGLVPTPTFFVDFPTQLATDRYAFVGVSWYWTVARPRINSMCDANDLEGVTRAINGGLNGLQDRRTRWDRARGMGPALFIIRDASPALGEDDFLSALSPDEQRRVYNWLEALFNGILGQRPSRSPARHLGEGTVGNVLDLICNTDGSTHLDIVQTLAQLGHPPSLALLREIAEADPVKYPDRQADKMLARNILANLPASTVVQTAAAPMPTPFSMPSEPPAQNGPLAIEPSRPLAPAPQVYIQPTVVPPPVDEPGRHAADEVQGELVDSTSGVGEQLGRLTDEAHTFADALTVAEQSYQKLSK